MIGRNAIGAKQHEVFDLGIGKFHLVEDGIIETGRAAFGNGESQGAGFTRRFTLRGDTRFYFAAAAVVHGWAASSGSFRAALLQLFLGAEAIVSVAAGEQLLCGLAVEVEALRLVERAFIPVEAE